MSLRDIAHIQALAQRLRAQCALAPPGAQTHSQRLELAARLLGFQHWHEAIERQKASRDPAPSPAAERAGARLRAIAPGARSGEPALREGSGPSCIRFDAFSLPHRATLARALRYQAAAMPIAPGWSPSAWRIRAVSLFDALLPAILEGAGKGAWALDESSLRRFCSWEGIAALKASHEALSESSIQSARAWARPWHNSFAAPEDPARMAFEPVAQMWGGVLGWLGALSRSPGPDWAPSRAADLCIEALPRPMALASALLWREGASAPSLTGLAPAGAPMQASGWLAPEFPAIQPVRPARAKLLLNSLNSSTQALKAAP